ncbi:MAG: LysR substrate-binding domain-containing protein [Bacteroidales bacterium]|nr:LysR substrate-binding domain-containing protein [Bacteroidales bacterium]
MTLQQLEYVVALDEQRHFAKAAEVCNITQSTLSSMIHKLEEELDITIFDRACHPVQPTLAGENLIKQAREVLFKANQLNEMSKNEKAKNTGNILIGITSTVGPYIMPKLFKYMSQFQDINLTAKEMYRDDIISKLKTAEIDMAIMSYPENDNKLLEIPLYNEKLYAYVSPNDELSKYDKINLNTMPCERLWVLKHEINFQRQIPGLENYITCRNQFYETGNIASLLRIVDENLGFTVLPELHIPILRESSKRNVKEFTEPIPTRTVSLFVRKDYVRESFVNIIIDGIKTIIPNKMIVERLKKYKVRL